MLKKFNTPEILGGKMKICFVKPYLAFNDNDVRKLGLIQACSLNILTK